MSDALSNREDYPSLALGSYLNQASLGLIGAPAVAEMHRFLDDIARHGNLRLSDQEEVDLLTPLRANAARLFGAPEDRVAITSGAAEMLSQLPALIAPTSGSQVLAVATDFPALTRPWLAYAQECDVELHFVEDRPDRDLTDELIAAISQRTSVVLTSLVQYSTGTCVDVQRVGDAARGAGALLVLDVTQAAGAVPVDLASRLSDVVVCSGYKWLGGHGGVGLAVLSDELLRKTPPAPGWMGAPDPFDMHATKLFLADGARRYTQSTMSYISVVGLTTAIGKLLDLGIDPIEQHARELSQRLSKALSRTGWTPFRSLEDPAASPHIVSLRHSEVDGDVVLNVLREAGVTCSVRNGRVRISLAHYNNAEDIALVSDALKQTLVSSH